MMELNASCARTEDCSLYPASKQRPSGVLGLFSEFMEQQTTWPTSNHLLAFLLPCLNKIIYPVDLFDTVIKFCFP